MKISDHELKEMISRMEWKQDLLGIWKPVGDPGCSYAIEIPYQSWIPDRNLESIHKFKIKRRECIHVIW